MQRRPMQTVIGAVLLVQTLTVLPVAVADGPEPFKCTTKGRFADLADPDCKSYYLCNQNTDGSLIPARVTCPGTTIFSPEKMTCVASPPNICPRTTTTEGPAPSSTVSDASGPFQCPGQGRYENVNSPDCTTYYLCLLEGDRVLPSLAQCSSSQVFDPSQQKCVLPDMYACPNRTPPTVSPPALTTPATSSGPTTNIPLTTPEQGPSSTTTNIPLTTPSTTNVVTPEPTTNIPLTTPDIGPPSTTTPESTTNIPLTTPDLGPSSTTTVETPEPTSNIPLTTPGLEPSSSTAEVTQEPTTSLPPSTPDEPTTSLPPSTPDMLPSPTTTEATPDSTTGFPLTTPGLEPSSTASTTPALPVITTTTSPSAPFQCVSEGRYPNPSVAGCKSYILCVRNSIGTLTPLTFDCPPTTIFSPSFAMCVTAAIYTCGNELTTGGPSTTEPSPSTTMVPSTTPAPYVCTGVGRFPDPDSIYCKSYYLCLYDGNLKLIGVQLTCPIGSVFAVEEARCASADIYRCGTGGGAEGTTPVTTTTTTTTTSTTTVATSTLGLEGDCRTAGKFPLPNECASYRFCVLLSSGELVEFIFKCPGGTVFDEQRQACSDRYECTRA
uniref:Chitin-binding type-2 domain-containing protein n=1 Tax=Anopheles epiroticus TaxID=199890 RepID=A0A182PFX7_9DIPT